MSAVQVSSSTEFLQVNTTTQGGRILLPSTIGNIGRILTIKDIAGTFFNNPLTLSTNGLDRFETGDSLKILREPFGYLTLASGGNNRWYLLDGTSLNSYAMNTVRNNLLASTQTISSSAFTVSTATFRDQLLGTFSSIYARSTLLYLGSNVIGGSMVGPTLFLRTAGPFLPNQLANLAIWYDANDLNTINLRGTSVVTWFDKSGNARNATYGSAVTNPAYTTNQVNGLPVVANTGNSGLTGTLVVNGLTNMFIFVVVNNTSATNYTNNTGYYLLWWNETGAWGQIQLYISQTRIDWRFGTSQVGNQPTYPLNSPANVGTTYNIFMISKVGTAETAYQNGTLVASYTAANTTIQNTSSTFIITGPSLGTLTYSTNNIAEILIYTGDMSASRQRIEGYLAWKWGLVANLPANHPFKNTPP